MKNLCLVSDVKNLIVKKEVKPTFKQIMRLYCLFIFLLENCVQPTPLVNGNISSDRNTN